ncbi:hypothetical protein HPB50_016292 [Hyalomma asiaticum]|uniref:Uncharacterized protein n=1 Tax=Hyalomma asiaticum TaxID=266040 RepID=A0ACB7S6T8_HYAAI|nr:hypothetical protein HPB50_016292 [Hyalomma asiaticum]
MAGSQRAATAVAYGRGTPSVSVPRDYRIVLPTVSTGDAMKRAVVLHCDILGRPYRIEDFRKPLEDAGVIKDVAVIVEFSMCDISARMHCLAERSKIGQTVTGKYANAIRVSNSIAAATARPTVFRFIAFETRDPNLRHIVAKGDAASVRSVRSTPGKKRRNARVAVASVSTGRARLIRATEAANVSDTETSDESNVAPSAAQRFGHSQEACTRSYARAVGRPAASDQSELMDEEEAEQAAAPAASFNNENAQGDPKYGSVSGHQSATVVDSGDDVRQAPRTANADGVDSEHSREESAREQRDARSVSQIPEAAGAELGVTEAAAEKMDAETAPAKRRHGDVVAVSQSQRLRQIEASVGVGAKKARSGARVRASSPSRGDVGANF